MPGNFIKSGQTRPKLVNGDQEFLQGQLPKVVKCRSSRQSRFTGSSFLDRGTNWCDYINYISNLHNLRWFSN